METLKTTSTKASVFLLASQHVKVDMAKRQQSILRKIFMY